MLDDLRRIEGLFVGQLDKEELWLFNKAVEDGIARRSYVGSPGFLGLAKVALNRDVKFPEEK